MEQERVADVISMRLLGSGGWRSRPQPVELCAPGPQTVDFDAPHGGWLLAAEFTYPGTRSPVVCEMPKPYSWVDGRGGVCTVVVEGLVAS